MASFSVVSNISASNAQANLNTTSIGLQRTLTRLSSGFRINQSGDDAAGLARRQQLPFRTSPCSTQGVRNANDGLSDAADQGRRAQQHLARCSTGSSTLATQSASAEPRRSTATTLNAEFPDVARAKSTVKRRVAGLTTAQGFSVFVSDRRRRTARSAAPSARPTRPRSASARSTSTTAGNAATAVATISTAVGTLGTVAGDSRSSSRTA